MARSSEKFLSSSTAQAFSDPRGTVSVLHWSRADLQAPHESRFAMQSATKLGRTTSGRPSPFFIGPLPLLLVFGCFSARRSCSRRSRGGSSKAILAAETIPSSADGLAFESRRLQEHHGPLKKWPRRPCPQSANLGCSRKKGRGASLQSGSVRLRLQAFGDGLTHCTRIGPQKCFKCNTASHSLCNVGQPGDDPVSIPSLMPCTYTSLYMF